MTKKTKQPGRSLLNKKKLKKAVFVLSAVVFPATALLIALHSNRISGEALELARKVYTAERTLVLDVEITTDKLLFKPNADDAVLQLITILLYDVEEGEPLTFPLYPGEFSFSKQDLREIVTKKDRLISAFTQAGFKEEKDPAPANLGANEIRLDFVKMLKMGGVLLFSHQLEPVVIHSVYAFRGETITSTSLYMVHYGLNLLGTDEPASLLEKTPDITFASRSTTAYANIDMSIKSVTYVSELDSIDVGVELLESIHSSSVIDVGGIKLPL